MARATSSLWSKLKPNARLMRHEQTAGEALLWEHLRDRKCSGLKFRRQHVIGRFIVDFYCPAAKVVIEVDGAIHQRQIEEDQAREIALTEMGLRVLRFDNGAVFTNVELVLSRVAATLDQNTEQD